MQLEFRRIQRELGVTTINVTHDQREALVVSDEIIVMDGGVHPADGAARSTPTAQPANAFVANFIGVTNFIGRRASLRRQGDRRRSRRTELRRARRPARRLRRRPGVVGAIRAEQIRIAPDRQRCSAGSRRRSRGSWPTSIFEGERIVYEVDVPALGGSVLRVFDHDPDAHRAVRAGRRRSPGLERPRHDCFKQLNC